MAANWTNVENALWTYVSNVSGLDSAHVIWAHQNKRRPDGPSMVLELTDDRVVGFPDEDQVYHSGDPAGTDLELIALQTVDVGLRISCYAPPTNRAGGDIGVPAGDINPRVRLSRVRIGASLDSIVQLLDAVGVSIYDPGTVQYLPAVIGTDFEARAVLDMRFYILDSVSERTTWIEHTQVTDDLSTLTPDTFEV